MLVLKIFSVFVVGYCCASTEESFEYTGKNTYKKISPQNIFDLYTHIGVYTGRMLSNYHRKINTGDNAISVK